MNKLIQEWEHELDSLKADLYELGNKYDSFKYNLLATEALRLSQCINNLYKVMLNSN